ncbi:YggT family protein [Curtobacterium aurantiacum]|uniref:YggT family protein n=1 Tax=Curtobacterium aurantiacum TaxID=3236919 RepID=UPI001BE128AF|nr:YggT family protein [Curtobacterium flaccumfaciens]MBT1677517.1 YggT family protein [Curtobacterium flaccumfaciens pv. flaccumfaciens]
MVSAIFTILYFLLLLYFFTMWGRFALDLVQSFNRSWRPRGGMLVVSEFVYTVTDPPIRAVRRVLPPLRLGPVALDFGWTIVMLVVIIAMSIVRTIS